MGKSQRDKGAKFERRIARWLSKVLGQDVHRQTNEPQQGNMGDVRVDTAWGTTLVVQAKHQKAPNPWAALKEAEEAAATSSTTSPSELPVACIRRHGGEDLVVMRPWLFALLLCTTHSVGRRAGPLPVTLRDVMREFGW